MGKRKVRRVQYFPHLVLNRVLNDDFLRTLVHIIYTAKIPVSAGYITRQVNRLLKRSYTVSYVCVYLKRLEKWGVLRPYKDPVSGHLLWWRADSTVADMISKELGRQEMKRVVEALEGW